ncbi:MAG: hypothetical protein ABIV48_03185 [Pyrinomonadaceae bacterium]
MNHDIGTPDTPEPENRRVERAPSELRTIVQVKESDTESWKELTRVTTVSRNGAGFSLARPCKVGRLVTLVMPLDRELRAYDEDAEIYPVMGLVQYCNEGMMDGKTIFHVGVGFVGKHIPHSYKTDPTQNYRIVGMRKDGLWEISEVGAQFKNRKQPRYWMNVRFTISLLQKADNSGAKEDVITQNIGAGGLSAACSLDAAVGEKVKVACQELEFYAVAIVRNRKLYIDGSRTIHLEFVESEFPVDKIISSRMPPQEGKQI